ncbi:MAG: 50S ribosomal protein L29 [Candidatus Liptonbacteria bacterium CG11_big_fil_rev_8_21_14_0_20_35_14]|uniref:Large ribosomal subunit protein uL29 n=1 Tax=Candidatus Liptonbacteria bacterium CG11_big_fil_rev_8_21_14_0_20_35_14 TaxID=1974634 RepID=A0A2H0N856_9BACT|nr:MAG: 50S ribosomal protein L29 [Candidatus Liptonbacteria bacterium CG11_big_fil_rev_8_21_14_0_20_35_14]
MKRKKFLDSIKHKSNQELLKTIKETTEKLKNLRFDLYSGKVKNVKAINNSKKEIARMLTVINKKAKEEIKK